MANTKIFQRCAEGLIDYGFFYAELCQVQARENTPGAHSLFK